MRPIVLVHGYSAESTTPDFDAIHKIYGDLPDALRKDYPVIEIDLSRWISLNDGVTVRDIALAFDRLLHAEHIDLLADPGFDAIIHSTGALVLRTWVRLFSKKPSPLRNLIHLAGANLGSGWAIIGEGQLSRWLRFLGQGGAQRGLKVLQALEFGSSQSIDLHLDLIQEGTRMFEDFQVQEYSIVGSQPHPDWFEFPVRYAKEDGSDGTVRVSSSNLNFNYLRIEPIPEVSGLLWTAIQTQLAAAATRALTKEYYRVTTQNLVDVNRPRIPFAIPFQCAHGGDATGIVSGAAPKTQVRKLIKLALDTPARSPEDWKNRVQDFDQETAATYRQVPSLVPSALTPVLESPANQYDPHAQLSFRFQDQNGEPIPVKNVDIFIVSDQSGAESIPFQKLIEDTVISAASPHVITFFLRVDRFDPPSKTWIRQLKSVGSPSLEITAIDPAASPQDPIVAYLPLKMTLTTEQLEVWLQGHRATIVDVVLTRFPSPSVYRTVPYPKGP